MKKFPVEILKGILVSRDEVSKSVDGIMKALMGMDPKDSERIMDYTYLYIERFTTLINEYTNNMISVYIRGATFKDPSKKIDENIQFKMDNILVSDLEKFNQYINGIKVCPNTRMKIVRYYLEVFKIKFDEAANDLLVSLLKEHMYLRNKLVGTAMYDIDEKAIPYDLEEGDTWGFVLKYILSDYEDKKRNGA